MYGTNVEVGVVCRAHAARLTVGVYVLLLCLEPFYINIPVTKSCDAKTASPRLGPLFFTNSRIPGIPNGIPWNCT